ncbi:uncharacterized protein DNG_09515 [Cephalotrichum gorgonifer]|uniref:Uncharacterized protein n=1 Tax=Cephalotrichum gorgonifer TaxID=2041049 RepID=A0AAE8N5U6_9PEZI|nr:uncharacterized protein DNG_09515 [Cephalotrichum gorgonifer]
MAQNTVLGRLKDLTRASMSDSRLEGYTNGPFWKILLPDAKGDLRVFGRVLHRFVAGDDECDGLAWELCGFRLTEDEIVPEFPPDLDVSERIDLLNHRLVLLQELQPRGDCYRDLDDPELGDRYVPLVGGHKGIRIPWSLRRFLGTATCWSNLILYHVSDEGLYYIASQRKKTPLLSYETPGRSTIGQVVQFGRTYLHTLHAVKEEVFRGFEENALDFEMNVKRDGYAAYNFITEGDAASGITLDRAVCASYSFIVDADNEDLLCNKTTNRHTWKKDGFYFNLADVALIEVAQGQLDPVSSLAVILFMENHDLLEDSLEYIGEGKASYREILALLDQELAGYPNETFGLAGE